MRGGVALFPHNPADTSDNRNESYPTVSGIFRRGLFSMTLTTLR